MDTQCQDTADVPTVKFNFVSIQALQEVAKDTVCGASGSQTDSLPILLTATTQTSSGSSKKSANSAQSRQRPPVRRCVTLAIVCECC